MTILKDAQDLTEALNDFAQNNPTFPAGFVEIVNDAEARWGTCSLEYRCESGDRITQDIDYPLSWEDFEIQLAEFWDLIDFKEEGVKEVA